MDGVLLLLNVLVLVLLLLFQLVCGLLIFNVYFFHPLCLIVSNSFDCVMLIRFDIQFHLGGQMRLLLNMKKFIYHCCIFICKIIIFNKLSNLYIFPLNGNKIDGASHFTFVTTMTWQWPKRGVLTTIGWLPTSLVSAGMGISEIFTHLNESFLCTMNFNGCLFYFANFSNHIW